VETAAYELSVGIQYTKNLHNHNQDTKQLSYIIRGPHI